MQAYRFADVEIRPTERLVLLGGQPAALQAKAFELLLALVERRERVVSRAELYDTVWAGRVVEDNNLAVQVHALRKLLGERAVVTVPGRGYRFALAADDAPQLAPAHAAAQVAKPVSASPPMPTCALHGRDDDLAALGRLLAQHRLVSVVGAGGIGKTVLALAAAHAHRSTQPGNPVWVELAPILDPALLAGTVAQGFGLALAGADPVPVLATALAPVQALLVLDNAEHLVGAVADLAAALLGKAPGIRLLVTSQAPLKIDGERVFRLNALAVPEAGTALDEAVTFGAVALFAEAAAAADRRFVLDAANVATVIEVCRRLDGMPLAIKLAAARLPFLGLHGLAQRLAERLELVGGNRRDAPTRQQTLRAALDWSHALLAADEQVVFRRLSVFVGGFTLALAADAARDEAHDGNAVIEALSALVDRSLVEAGDADPPRYRLLESAREYALAQLERAGEGTVLRQRHAQVMAAWTEQRPVAALVTSGAWLMEAALEVGNVRAALDWSALHDAPLHVTLIGATFPLFGSIGEVGEFTRRSNAAAARLPVQVPATIEGRYWITRAQAHAARDTPAMHEFAARAESLFRGAGNRPGLYWALCCRLWSGHVPATEGARLADEAVALEFGLPPGLLVVGRMGQSRHHYGARRYTEAARDLDAAIAHARAAGLAWMEAMPIGMRATTHYAVGEIEEGIRLVRPCIAAQPRRSGPAEIPLGCLGVGLVLKGETTQAREVLAEFFRLCRADDWWFFNLMDEAYALLALQEGRLRSAARLLGYIEHKARQVRALRMAEVQTRQARAALEASLGAAELRRLLDDGAALGEDQVCALTLEATDSPALAAAKVEALSSNGMDETEIPAFSRKQAD